MFLQIELSEEDLLVRSSVSSIICFIITQGEKVDNHVIARHATGWVILLPRSLDLPTLVNMCWEAGAWRLMDGKAE